MSEWREVVLGELVTFENGDRSSNYPRTVDNDPSGIPFVSASDISESGIDLDAVRRISSDAFGRLRSGKFMEGDLIYCLRGTIGKIARVPPGLPGAIASSLVILRAEDEFLNGFVYYFLKSAKGQSEAIALNNGSAQPNLSVRLLSRLTLNLPPKSEMVRIVILLKALDDKIELNRRMNETLEAMARAIFKDWFVDFGPTRARAEGRGPYLAPELWGLFPDALDDEDMPDGWSSAPLTALAEMNPESWSRKNTPEEVAYVDLANTKWGTIEATQRFRWQDAPSRAKRILRPGDTIIGMVRPGNGSFAFVSDSGLTGSTGFAVLRPRQSRYTELVFFSATAPENIERLANLADGAAYPAVRPEVVGGTEVTFCEDAVATSFSALVFPILDRMESNKRENHTLAQARDLLLPRLMSGEIRLREAENAVEAVA